MKKWILPLLLIVLSNAALQAQEGFHVGARMTPLASFLINQDDWDESAGNLDIAPTYNFGFGLHTQYSFTDYVGIAVSPFYATWGQRYENANTNAEWYQQLQYVRVPIAFRFNTDPYSTAMFVFETGPELGFLAGASTDANGDIEERYDIAPEDYNGIDLSWTLNFGAGFNLSDYLTLDVLIKLDYGLSEVESEDYKPTLIGLDNRGKTNHGVPAVVVGLNYLLN